MKFSQVLVIDALAAAIYLIAANPAITGLLVHEWASLGVFLVIIIHTAQHYDGVIDAFKRLRQHPPFATIGNLVLNILTAVVFMVVIVSGIMVSRHILPALGLVAPGYFFWNPLHALFAKVLLALLILHVVIHGQWLWSHIKGLIGTQV
jgi:hypothetical protein